MINLKIIQFKPEYKNIEANFFFIKNTIQNSVQKVILNTKNIQVKTDIILFPEMSLSGYFFDDKNELKKYAITKDSIFLKELQEISTFNNLVIIFGFAEFEDNSGDEKIYNSSISISPNPSETKIYRKSHLFYKENIVFDKYISDSVYKSQNFIPQYISHLDLNIGNIICYDWRFPEITQQYALNGADLIVCPANLVTRVWKNSLPARALDNRVFFALSNRIGTEHIDESLYFTGCSSFYDTNGNLIGQLTETESGELDITFDHLFARDKSINKYNNIFADRRTDLY